MKAREPKGAEPEGAEPGGIAPTRWPGGQIAALKL
jgi:hypothetical protein